MFGAKQLLYEWMKACDHATIEYTKWGTQAELVKRKMREQFENWLWSRVVSSEPTHDIAMVQRSVYKDGKKAMMEHISSAAKLLVNFSLLAGIVFKIFLNLGWEICFYQKISGL